MSPTSMGRSSVLSAGAAGEVIEDVLLGREPSGVVPVLAVFPAAPGVCDRDHSALLQPWQPARSNRGLREMPSRRSR